MITLAEVGIAALWAAAAIVVGGYTWEAYTGEQHAFPGIGTGPPDPSTTPPGQNIPSHPAQIGPGGITPGTGGTPLEPTPGIPAGPNVKAPPLVVVSPITNAIANHDRMTAMVAVKRLIDWANQPGPKKQGWNGSYQASDTFAPGSGKSIYLTGTIALWMAGQPWFPKLHQLTGLRVLKVTLA